MTLRPHFLWPLAAFSVIAHAAAPKASEAEPGVISVSVAVGETTTVDVGHAKGIFCDGDIVKADITGGETSNQVSLTGLKEGSTLCRAGSDALGAKRMIRVKVTPKDGPVPGTRTNE